MRSVPLRSMVLSWWRCCWMLMTMLWFKRLRNNEGMFIVFRLLSDYMRKRFVRNIRWRVILGKWRRRDITGDNGAWGLSCFFYSDVPYPPTRSTSISNSYDLIRYGIYQRYMSSHEMGWHWLIFTIIYMRLLTLWRVPSTDAWHCLR